MSKNTVRNVKYVPDYQFVLINQNTDEYIDSLDTEEAALEKIKELFDDEEVSQYHTIRIAKVIADVSAEEHKDYSLDILRYPG